jgi:general stress protein YciG
VAKEDRGFASMDRSKQKEIASKGGKAAHHKGTAHEWTSEEAREAGRKGGMASHRRKQEQAAAFAPATPGTTEAGEAGAVSSPEDRTGENSDPAIGFGRSHVG